jgi:hypothetical protein
MQGERFFKEGKQLQGHITVSINPYCVILTCKHVCACDYRRELINIYISLVTNHYQMYCMNDVLCFMYSLNEMHKNEFMWGTSASHLRH